MSFRRNLIFFFVLLVFCYACKRSLEDRPLNHALEEALKIDYISFDSDSLGLKRSIHYVDSCFSQVPSPGLMDYARRYESLAHFNYYFHNYQLAIAYDDSIMLLRGEKYFSEKHPVEYSSAMLRNGESYLGLGEFDKAYSYYYKVKKMVDNIKDSCAKSDYHYLIAMALYRQRNFEEAHDYFKLALEEIRPCQVEFRDFYRHQELLGNMGLCQFNLGNYDKALSYFNEAMNTVEANKGLMPPGYYYEIAKAVIYGNMAKVYRMQGRFELAEKYLKKSIHINLAPLHDLQDAQLTMLELTRLYLQQKRWNEANQELNLLQGTLDTIPNSRAMAELNRLRWQLNDKTGDIKEAYRYLSEVNRQRDSADAGNTGLRNMDIRHRIDFVEKQEENKALKADNESTQTLLWASVIFGLMLVLIATLIGMNYKRSRGHVNELKELNEQVGKQKAELEQALARLEDRDKERARILRVVAHDLRNPLGGIHALTELMLQDFPKRSDHYENIDLIHKSAAGSLSMITELLDAEAKTTLYKTKENIYSLISNGIELLQYKAAEKHQRIFWNPPAGGELLLNADHDKLWRVLNNLIINAIKFSDENKTIQIRTEIKDGKFILVVEDEGIGIPENLKDKVFDTFSTARREGTSGEKSFGLGMAISQQIIEAHGGKIRVESEEGRGSRFFMELPL
jgi:two-component system sensor histidine kinase VicK